MIFLNPLGLLGFLGLPLLIFLYLKRQKYEERKISSTYLWKLSELFYRKYMPMQRMKKILLFSIQALMILLCSLLIAQPRVLSGNLAQEYLAILDATASMQIKLDDGKTRFEHAKDQVLNRIETLGHGSNITVLRTGMKEPLISRTQSIQEARRAVEQAACTFTNHMIESSFEKASEIIGLYPDAEVVFYTDKSYPETKGIQVIDVSTHREWNAAITGLRAYSRQDGTDFMTDVISYGRDAQITIALYIDQRLVGAKMVLFPDGETITLVWNVDGVTDYSEIRAVLNVTDSLDADNAFWLFPPPKESIRVLLASEHPFFLSNALNAFPAVQVITVSTLDEFTLEDFDIYVFDGLLPDTLPGDGAIWIFNPPFVPKGIDLVFGEMLVGGSLNVVYEISNPELIGLTKNITLQDAAAARFREILSTGSFTTLMLCGRMPLVLAGKGENGSIQIVASFNIRESNLPLLSDFVYFINNALRYSMPEILDGQMFQVGQTLNARVLPFTDEIYLLKPDNLLQRLAFDQGVAAFTPEQTGAYTLLQHRGKLKAKSLRFFAAFPDSESNPALTIDKTPVRIITAGITNGAVADEGAKYLFNPDTYLAAALLLLLILELVVFHNEQT